MTPNLNNRFVCIVGRTKPILAGVVLSYIQIKGQYTPLFVFPEVEVKRYAVDESDENYVMVTRAYEMGVRIRNAISALRGCDYLILVGIDENQKSYLGDLEKYNIVEIQNIGDADLNLVGLTDKTEYFLCKEADFYKGLFIACEKKSFLKIDNDAPDLNVEIPAKECLVVIENHKNSSVIVAINYGLSIDADIAIIDPPDISHREITNCIEDWKNTGENTFLNDLGAKIYPKVEVIDFTQYQFATFFTFGVPYSLILKNIIPFTNVHIDLNPDFFIFNNLYFEESNSLFSSIVFSPLEFGTDEETNFLIRKLKDKNYYVKELVGKEASSFNIDRHVSEFPYNILHICSHGGEVDGFPVVLDFKDRDGNTHTIEFDEIVSFAPEPGNPMIQVTSKWIFRKFDGFYWRSKELKAQKFPHYVFSDMQSAISNSKLKRTERKPSIPDSCAIKCHDFNYQAMFNTIAGWHSSPFIFNNTCWSCSQISYSFLAVGSRGYIGTLWNVDNEVAKNVAESFYEKIFGLTILDALEISLVHTKDKPDENIYVFWGLHFATIKAGVSEEESRMKVASKLLSSFYRWRDHIKEVKNEKTKENINRLIDWNCDQLKKYFRWETLKLLMRSRAKHSKG